MEDLVDGAVGVQLVGAAAVADEAVQAPQHEDGPIDELENELLVLTWRGVGAEGPLPAHCLPGMGGARGQRGPISALAMTSCDLGKRPAATKPQVPQIYSGDKEVLGCDCSLMSTVIILTSKCDSCQGPPGQLYREEGPILR